MNECYVRGSTIKYLRIPDEVIDMVKDENIQRMKAAKVCFKIIFQKYFLKLNTRTEIVKIIATIVVTIAAVAVEITTAVVVVATETAVAAEAETETKVAKTDTELEKVKTHCPAHLIGQFRNIVHFVSVPN